MTFSSKTALLAVTAGMLVASPAFAATTIYSANPTGNSRDFAAAVAARGGQVVTNVTFDGAPVNATVSTTGTASTRTGTGPTDGNNFSTPISTGEGAHPSSGYLSLGAGSLTVNFLAPVFAAGLTTIDLYNPTGINPITLSAYTGANGTGALIGTTTAANFNFQNNYQYFLGLASDQFSIGSIVLTNGYGGLDTIGIDNVVSGVAAVPEPATWALMILGMGAVGFAMRRRNTVASSVRFA